MYKTPIQKLESIGEAREMGEIDQYGSEELQYLSSLISRKIKIDKSLSWEANEEMIETFRSFLTTGDWLCISIENVLDLFKEVLKIEKKK